MDDKDITIRQAEKLIDSMQPFGAQLRRFQEVHDRLAAMGPLELPVQDLVTQLTDTIGLLDQQSKSMAVSLGTLAASIRPFPDFNVLFPDPAASQFLRLNQALSAALEGATFLAELTLENEDGSASAAADDIEDRAEEQLIKVVPPSTLGNLKRIGFAPLVALDQVLRMPEALRALDARDFEGFVATLIEQLGFEDVVLTPRSGDRGRDVLATKRIHGISILCAFECKRYAAGRPVGPEIARALLGSITHGPTRATKGVLVTTSTFSPAARKFLLTEPSLDGKDFEGIMEWLKEYSSARGRNAIG